VWWWLKADGCVIGLKESVKLQWSGDVDLNDGVLQEQCDTYKKHLTMAKKVGLNRGENLKSILQDSVEDLDLIHSGISKIIFSYVNKINLCFLTD